MIALEKNIKVHSIRENDHLIPYKFEKSISHTHSIGT